MHRMGTFPACPYSRPPYPLRFMKSNDALKEYVSLRDSIFAEREQLISRLREMDEALGAMGLRGKDSYYGPRTPTGRVRNELSLKEAVIKVIDGKSLTKHEVLDAVLSLGYQFSTDDPLNSLGVILYGKNPKFKNDNGKFSLK
jgi:hypothetical protein